MPTTIYAAGNAKCPAAESESLKERSYSAYLMQPWLVLLCLVTLLGRKRGHWLTKPAENEDPAWQQERPPEIPRNLCVRICRGKRSSNALSSSSRQQHMVIKWALPACGCDAHVRKSDLRTLPVASRLDGYRNTLQRRGEERIWTELRKNCWHLSNDSSAMNCRWRGVISKGRHCN